MISRGGEDFPATVTQVRTVNGKTRSSVLDNSARTVTEISPENRTVTKLFDEKLQITEVQVPGLHPVIYDYYTDGRLMSVSVGERTTRYAYDDKGNLKTVTDPLGRVTSYIQDELSRTESVDPQGENTGENPSVFDYNGNGNLTDLTGPGSSLFKFGYNGISQKTSCTAPLSGTYAYKFEKGTHRQESVTFPSKETHTFIYDSVIKSRMRQIQTPEGNIDIGYHDTYKTLVKSLTMGTESLGFIWDSALLKKETRTGILNAELSWEYDNDFAVDFFTYAGATEDLDYDDDGLLTLSRAFSVERNTQNGLPDSVTDGTLTLTRNFNDYAENGGDTYAAGANEFYSWSVKTDRAGRIWKKTETLGGSTSVYVFGYDESDGESDRLPCVVLFIRYYNKKNSQNPRFSFMCGACPPLCRNNKSTGFISP